MSTNEARMAEIVQTARDKYAVDIHDYGFESRDAFDDWVKSNFDYVVFGHRLWAIVPATRQARKKMGNWAHAEISSGDRISFKFVYGANAPDGFTKRFNRTGKKVSLLDG